MASRPLKDGETLVNVSAKKVADHLFSLWAEMHAKEPRLDVTLSLFLSPYPLFLRPWILFLQIIQQVLSSVDTDTSELFQQLKNSTDPANSQISTPGIPLRSPGGRDHRPPGPLNTSGRSQPNYLIFPFSMAPLMKILGLEEKNPEPPGFAPCWDAPFITP